MEQGIAGRDVTGQGKSGLRGQGRAGYGRPVQSKAGQCSAVQSRVRKGEGSAKDNAGHSAL